MVQKLTEKQPQGEQAPWKAAGFLTTCSFLGAFLRRNLSFKGSSFHGS